MSATNRGSGSRPANDFYPTPEPTVASLCEQLQVTDTLRWGEPCVGDGSILKFMKLHAGVDYKAWEWCELSRGRDYLVGGLANPVDAIVTNPPFSKFEAFLQRSLKEAEFVAYLLRVNALGSQKRRDWWQGRTPTHLFTLSERPAFVSLCKKHTVKGVKKGCGAVYPRERAGTSCDVCGEPVSLGTDATEYAWFVWDKLGLCKEGPGICVI
jgi:hypothetical protein